MKKIYFDNASTTPVDKKVLNEMAKYWSVNFANPSSIHSIGVTAKITLQKARKTLLFYNFKYFKYFRHFKYSPTLLQPLIKPAEESSLP